jgi:predicted metal-dependent hydrolase
MPSKKFTLEDGLPVNIYKRRGSRNLRLTVSAEGEVRVSIPAWAPYRAGLDFARSRRDWILTQRGSGHVLVDGQPIGKAHHLSFQSRAVSRPASRVTAGAVVVTHPPDLDPHHPAVQRVARDGSIRALRAQAERLLPQRLAALAATHGFSYSGVGIKLLKSRWGSCDQNGFIALNLFLMQLPWEYIDYVLLHELVHTRVMRHGPDFWQAMTELMPDAKAVRRRLRDYRPAVEGASLADSPTAADMA